MHLRSVFCQIYLLFCKRLDETLTSFLPPNTVPCRYLIISRKFGAPKEFYKPIKLKLITAQKTFKF